MPARRVPRLSSLVGSLGAALVVVAVALGPIASPTVHAQDGAGPAPSGGQMGDRDGGPGRGPRMGPNGMDGGYGGGFGEIGTPGQIQYCQEGIGAQANAWSYYGPTFTGYNLPPYGGTWGFYTGLNIVCRWQPH